MNIRAFLLVIFTVVGGAYAEKFSIIAMSDPHMRSPRWIKALSEIRDRTSTGMVAPAVGIMVAGDIYASAMYPDYLSVFKDAAQKPDFLPCVGDHDAESASEYKRLLEVVDAIPHKSKKNEDVNYFVDYKNVRIIVVNMFKVGNNPFGVNHNINTAGRDWVESVIKSATQSDHVFIVFHGPAFPRIRHTTDSFNAYASERNAFWEMIMKYNDKVKAVIVGSVHYYFKMRVADPASKDANDVNNASNLPDQKGGIYQICPGSTGKVEVDCFVNIEIDGKSVDFRVFRASGQTDSPFKQIEQFSIGKNDPVGVKHKQPQSSVAPVLAPALQTVMSQNGSATFTYTSSPSSPSNFSIYTLNGSLVHSFRDTPSLTKEIRSVVWQPGAGSSSAASLYVVRMQSEGAQMSRSFYVRK